MKSPRPKNAKTVRKAKASGRGGNTRATDKRASILNRTSKRAVGAGERRDAIMAAGLDEFTARGFAATRLDDVAKRAGVAKGTIYLHFKDKDALFEELVRTALGPLIERLANPPLAAGIPARAMMDGFADMIAREVVGTKRGDILRLIISEGSRFPTLADFYYRDVVTHGIAGLRKMIDYGVARGEIHHRGLADFPQLIVAPAIVAVIWQGLFGKQAPLDTAGMLRVHIDLIFSEGRAA